MSRRHAAAIGTAGLATLVPAPAAAHAIGGTFQLPVPLWLYLVGAGIAVAASFFVTALAIRAPRRDGTPSRRQVSDGTASVVRLALRILGALWWYGAIVVGFAVGDISPLPAVLVWIGIWVGLPIVAILAGNPWPSLSPFRSTFEALEWVAARAGLERLDLGVSYPPRLARWPAVALLTAGLWAELVLPGSSVAGTVASLMIGYTLLTLGGMLVFGPVAWLRNAELFEVELAWFGRVGPISRSSRSPELCDGCGERCDPGRCVDCPECAVAASDAERGVELRPWIVGLTDVRSGGWSDVAFIVTVLAGVTYDGLRETAAGAAGFDATYPIVAAILGPASAITFLLVETLQLAAVIAGFLAAFVAVSWLTRNVSSRRSMALGSLAGRYAATLLPIAGVYLIAHYLTLVIQGIVWLPSLVADPLQSLAPPLDAIPVAVVWYLSVTAIVGGHIAAIVLAHRLTLEQAPRRATLAGLPIVALMVGYTVLSLWIIASPIVVEPGTVPATGLFGR